MMSARHLGPSKRVKTPKTDRAVEVGRLSVLRGENDGSVDCKIVTVRPPPPGTSLTSLTSTLGLLQGRGSSYLGGTRDELH